MIEGRNGWTRARGLLAIACVASRQLNRLVWGSVLLAVSVPSAIAQVGVTEGGSASYSIPIVAPPGIAGMAPNMGLTYGGGSNGPVGFGWAISGLSTITRCPQTRGIDGFARGVNFDKNDKLCLDGQRLIQTDVNGVPTNGNVTNPSSTNIFQSNDSLGVSGTVASIREYRTEKDTFARVRAYGSAGNDATGNSGPAYFKVWTKSGQIYEYGASPGADLNTNALIAAQGKSVAMVWAVSRISDTLGNYIDFKYIQRDSAWGTGPTAGSPQLGREWNLVEIQYTGNGTQVPMNKVVFDYADRVDNPGGPQSRAEAYQAGSKNLSIWRLNAVRTYVNWAGPGLGVTAQGSVYPAAAVAPTNAGNVIAPPATAIKVKTVKIGYSTGPNTGRLLVSSIAECVGATETRCTPASTFLYAPGGNQAFQANPKFNASAMSTTTRLLDATNGNFGALLGDFNSDGKTDILRWGNNPADNELWLSNGDGTFTNVPSGTGTGQFNLKTQYLFSSDACYSSMVADFNGDGIADILRTVQPTSNGGVACAGGGNQLFLGNGDGSFKAPVPLAGIDLSVVTEKVTSTRTSCTLAFGPLRDGDRLALATEPHGVPDSLVAQANGYCFNSRKTEGKAFHLLDVNGDGIPDIVTTISPSYATDYATGRAAPTPDESCASVVCTRVYLGSTSGAFTELPTSNLAHHSVYVKPPAPGVYAAFVRPSSLDFDGDGLTDLVVKTGAWRSTGDGNFTLVNTSFGVPACASPIDLNGDGRLDCIGPTTVSGSPSNQNAQVMNGVQLVPVAGFNLTQAGDDLWGLNASTQQQSIGMLISDFNGDGRSGVLRWQDDPTKNRLYLSNGDGTFRTSQSFGLTTANRALRNSDGTASYLSGDFTGRGSVEILRMKDALVAGSEGTTNQLYEKIDKTPPDQLLSVTSPSGLKTTLTWVPLSNPFYAGASGSLGTYPRYISDRGTPAAPKPNTAVYPQVDLTMPTYVVATSVSDTGVGSATVATEYVYVGLKADINRGLLGFRETRRQSFAPNGSSLTTVKQALQIHPYIGATSQSQTFNGNLWSVSNSANAISTSVYSYCDKTATTLTPPCATTAKVQKPFQSTSVETGIDPAGIVLPTVTTANTFDLTGNPTSITVTTTGSALGLNQTFSKTTTNIYLPEVTTGDNWVLGRLQSATQRNTVPNSLASIATSAGSSPTATAIKGGIAQPPLSPAVLAVILQLLLED